MSNYMSRFSGQEVDERIGLIPTLKTELSKILALLKDGLNSEYISDGAITTQKIDFRAVTNDKIAPSAVGTQQIASKAVNTLRIANDAVTTDKIANDAVTEDKIANDSVTSNKIGDNAVTGEKLDDGSITDEKIVDKTISESKLNEEVISAIHSNKFDGEIELYPGMNWDILEFPIKTIQIYKLKMEAGNIGSGGILIVNCNYYEDSETPLIVYSWSQTRILNNYIDYRETTSIVNNKPDAWSEWESRYLDKEVLKTINATITTHKDAKTLDHPDGSVTTEKIDGKAVTTEKIADGAVTSEKIADKAVSSQHLSEEVGERIDSNKFDGVVESHAIDEYEFPVVNGTLIYKLVDEGLADDLGGLLLVGALYNRGVKLVTMYQTKIIISTGEILTRRTTETSGTKPVSWSEWKSVYTTVDDTATLSNCVETMAQEISENTLKINNILATDEAEYKTVESNKLILRSSTEGSTKKFALAVDDSGTINVSEFLDKIIDDTEIEFE